ncbi:Uncharacterized membrane-anchored protein YjiN, DUF445 family [Rhizobiales bacterium GAS113]|nr:Uncharacterized membrane-anchored protein YjiN, DUF445 family [Rhizobiales bacterium GAS113]
MTDDYKRSQLRRMQRLAIAVVLVMLALFLISTAWQQSAPWLRWLRAFSEAGVAGAMADWYAVVALFRRPFGLPIPHTAIIPKNKDRIAESVGAFIETHFLTAENVVEKLGRFDLAATMSAWLSEPANSGDLADALCDLIPPTLATVEDEEVKAFLVRMIASQFDSLDFVVIANRLMTTITEQDRSRVLLARILLWLQDWVSENRGAIKAKFGQVSRYTPGFLDTYIVNRFVDGISALLREAAENPNHEIWLEVDRAVAEMREKLTESPDFRTQIGAIARETLGALGRSDFVATLWADLKRDIIADLSSEPSQIRTKVAAGFMRLGATLTGDPHVRHKMNAWWLAAIKNALPRVRPAIGRWIADIVKSWDAEEITRKLETEIGTDLQYIRLNGALVGGFIGLVLYAVSLWSP